MAVGAEKTHRPDSAAIWITKAVSFIVIETSGIGRLLISGVIGVFQAD